MYSSIYRQYHQQHHPSSIIHIRDRLRIIVYTLTSALRSAPRDMMPPSTSNPIVVSQLPNSQDNCLIEDPCGPESEDDMDIPIFSSAYLPLRSNRPPRIMPH